MRTNGLVAGLFALCSVFAFSSCETEEELKSDKNLYFEAEMSGKTLLLPEGKDGFESMAAAEITPSVAGCTEVQSMQFGKTDKVEKSLEIAIVKQRSSCTPDCTQSKAMLQQGEYTFGRMNTASDESITEGIVIMFTDPYGKVWSTDYGTANQSNSNFTVSGIEANTMDNKSEMLVTAEFNFTLYDGEGEEIPVTNGKLVGRSIVCK